MSRPARLSPEARRALAKALREMDHDEAAQALRDAVAEAARRLGDNPWLGRVVPFPRLERYRFWSLTRLGYLLVYDPHTDPVGILRLVHARRDLPRALAALGRSPRSSDPD